MPARASGVWKEHELVVDEEPAEGEASRKEEELLEECRKRDAAEGEYSAAELEGFSTRKVRLLTDVQQAQLRQTQRALYMPFTSCSASRMNCPVTIVDSILLPLVIDSLALLRLLLSL